MRGMTWCLGVLVLLAWHQSAVAQRGEGGTTWIAAMFFWFLVGVVALVFAVGRLIAGKMKGGVPSLVRGQGTSAPPIEKES